MKEIIEGETKLLVNVGEPTKRMSVFFNPKKEYDRSLSVKVVNHYKPRKCLDLLSASGARGIRLMVEAGVMEMIFNDSNPEALKRVKKNLELNSLKARVYNKDANQLLYDLGEYFDFIDIDPFGSPNPYLKSSIRFVQRGGLLGVTATDTAALVGARSRTCRRKYHAMCVRHPFMKETGLRILIRHVVETGAENDYALKPVIAHSTSHYFRAYFIKELGAKRSDVLLRNVKMINYCPKCGHRGYEPCEHKQCIRLGPIYAGSINSSSISPFMQEDPYPPWHYTTIELVKLFGLRDEPKLDYILRKVNGVKAHYSPKSIKTRKELRKS